MYHLSPPHPPKKMFLISDLARCYRPATENYLPAGTDSPFVSDVELDKNKVVRGQSQQSGWVVRSVLLVTSLSTDFRQTCVVRCKRVEQAKRRSTDASLIWVHSLT